MTNLFAALLALALPASAADLALPAAPETVEVPAASPAARMAPDAAALRSDYDEIYAALKAYSETAFRSAQGSPQLQEASVYGQYLRMRLEGVGAALQEATGERYEPSARTAPRVSGRVWLELRDAFGMMTSYRDVPDRGVAIKPGYCQINYVKNNVPFLVQYDGFLKPGEVILTFDDGPGPLTAEVSAALKDAGAPSVFFVLGAKLGQTGKPLLRRTADDGHEPAVHGYHHATPDGKPLTALSTSEILRQLGGVKRTITEVSGFTPRLFRPPYGIVTPEALLALDREEGLVPVGWTLDTLDWSTKDPEELFRKTTEMISKRGKGIVLMHDIHPQSRTAAIRLAGWLKANGFKVVSPDRLVKAWEGK